MQGATVRYKLLSLLFFC